jgi:hypothetical protein
MSPPLAYGRHAAAPRRRGRGALPCRLGRARPVRRRAVPRAGAGRSADLVALAPHAVDAVPSAGLPVPSVTASCSRRLLHLVAAGTLLREKRAPARMDAGTPARPPTRYTDVHAACAVVYETGTLRAQG